MNQIRSGICNKEDSKQQQHTTTNDSEKELSNWNGYSLFWTDSPHWRCYIISMEVSLLQPKLHYFVVHGTMKLLLQQKHGREVIQEELPTMTQDWILIWLFGTDFPHWRCYRYYQCSESIIVKKKSNSFGPWNNCYNSYARDNHHDNESIEEKCQDLWWRNINSQLGFHPLINWIVVVLLPLYQKLDYGMVISS